MRLTALVLAALALQANGANGITLAQFRALPDNRIAVRTSLGVRSARPIDARHVRVTIGMSVTDACRDPSAYRIVSFQDPAYRYERFLRPTRAVAAKGVEAVGPPGCPFRQFECTRVDLELPSPMRPGCTYYVIAQGSNGLMVTGGHTAQGFTFGRRQPRPPSPDPVDMAVIGLRRLEPVGPRLLMLEFGPGFAAAAGSRTAAYHVTIGGRTVAVTRLGRITRVDAYLPTGWPFAAIPMHEVYLQLAAPFSSGDAIRVAVDPDVTAGAQTAAITYGDRTSLTSSIKVNQVGYLTDSPAKIAYLGRWMGSFPEGATSGANPSLLYPSEPRFAVCDARTGRAVFAGKARLVHRSGQMDEGFYKVDHSGENVYILDFTRLRRPGRYFISVPQTGRSLPFEIGNRVYERAFRTQAAGLFAQRCGTALGPPYSQWRRIACHRRGLIATTQSRLEPHEIETLASKLDPTVPAPIHAYGGHHDAGDYNPRSHLDVAQTLMDAYEMAPSHFRDGQLNIPERANGVPDILDEAWWALRLWVGLQDSDGGVRNGTESNGDPNFIETVELDPKGDYAYAKDAAGSFAYAGAMAQAARIWRSLGRAKDANAYLARARRAYEWAIAHPPPPGAAMDAYRSPMAYAAAQMLRTTREGRFARDFAAACVWRENPRAELDEYQVHDQSRAAWAYACCPPSLADPLLLKAVRAAILRRADAFIHYSSTMAYAFLRHPQAPITWGTGGQLHWAVPVAWAYVLTGRTAYRLWLIRSCDYTLGANPICRSFIVGLGTRTVRAPLHNSRYSHLGEVVDGMQVNGPSERGDGYRVAETAYPKLRPNFASLYSFVDCHFAIAMDEGLSISQAEATAIFGLLLPNRTR